MNNRLRRVLVVGGTIVALFILYEILTGIVAYTDDAYVRSDLVGVAPEITGKVAAVHVVDNQIVKAGDRLVTIDPEPYRLAVNQRKAQSEQEGALLRNAQEELESARAALASARSALEYAQETQGRLSVLARTENAPRAALDKADDELRRSEAALDAARATVARARSGIAAQEAAVARAAAELATAQWALDRTELVAPVNGAIVNLSVRPGDTGTANMPLIGIVDDAGWRIVANYKQSYVDDFEIGGTAWVWLDSSPGRLHRARIAGIARGISREKEIEKLMPYVAPTTDWIRLQRRIPVTLTLVDPPAGLKLYMGVDARTVIFP